MTRKKEITPILDEPDSFEYPTKEQQSAEPRADMKKILGILESQKTSQTLDLSDQFIGDEGAPIVAQFLASNNTFSVIELRGNHLSSDGFAHIFQVLKDSQTIKAIQAEWNQIGSSNSGLEALHELAKASKTLTSVDLKNNQINSDAAHYIASIIRDSQTIESLDLRWNNLGDDGAKHIIEAIKNQSRKVRVDLSGNKISEDLLASLQEVQERTPKQNSEQGAPVEWATFKKPSAEPTPTNKDHTSPPSFTFNDPKTSSYFSQYLTNPSAKDAGTSEPKTQGYQGYSTEPSDYLRRFLSEKTQSTEDKGETKDLFSNIKYPSQLLSTPASKTYNPSSSYFSKDYKPASEYKSYLDNKPTLSTSTSPLFSSGHQLPVYPQKTIASPDTRSSQFFRSSASKLPSYQPEGDFKKIQSLYEQETKDIQQKYQAHMETHMKMAETLKELEAALQEEKDRANELEVNYKNIATAYEDEKKIRAQIEQKCMELGDELRKKDLLCSDLALRCEMLTQDAQHLRGENQKLNDELRKVDEQCSLRIKGIESQYSNQVNELTAQLEGMRREFERMAQTYTSKLTDLNKEWENKTQALDQQLRDAARALGDQENQIKGLNNYIQQIQSVHQEDLKRIENQLRNDQANKIQEVVKAAEEEIRRVDSERKEAYNKFEDLRREALNFEKKVNDERTGWQNEERRLRGEIEKLSNALAKFDQERNRFNQEIQNRDNMIANVARENEALKKEVASLREAQRTVQERMNQEFNNERQKIANAFRELENRNRELERMLKIAEEDSNALKRDYDKIKEILQGNINNIISQTFAERSLKSSVFKPPY